MKKKLLFTVVVQFFVITSQAQDWQENVIHNELMCFMLNTSDNITIYAAKGVRNNSEAIYMKIQVPYNWGKTSTGHVNIFMENKASGDQSSHSINYNYREGWLYIVEHLSTWCNGDIRRGNYPCNTYVVTIYENNDNGINPGKRIVVNTHLDKLNTARMHMNKVYIETHW